MANGTIPGVIKRPGTHPTGASVPRLIPGRRTPSGAGTTSARKSEGRGSKYATKNPKITSNPKNPKP